VQTSEADFKGGTLRNVVATNLGEVKLSRGIKTLLEQDPDVSTVTAMAESASDGAIYAGTGPKGVLLRLKNDKVERIAVIDDAVTINALLVQPDGSLLIATSGEKGRVYRLAKPADAKPIATQPVTSQPTTESTAESRPTTERSPAVPGLTELFSADDVQYVWGLARVADGTIYAATGPNGQLFAIAPDGSHEQVYKSDQANLTAILSDGKDVLYIGTDPEGLVVRWNRKTRESFVMYDAAESEISALALDSAGNLYAATGETSATQQPAQPENVNKEKAGRPEGGPGGAPLPTEPPAPAPKPPEPPNPNPGEPAPIPKAAYRHPSREDHESTRIDTNVHESNLQNSTKAIRDPLMNSRSIAYRSNSATLLPTLLLAADDEPEPGMPDQPGSQPNAAAAQPSDTNAKPTNATAANAEPKPEGNAIYKIDTDGFVTEVFREQVTIYSMLEINGVLLVGTGDDGQIYQVNPAAEETEVLAKTDAKEVSSLLAAADGKVYLGLANTGSMASMTRGFAESGTYTSSVLDATQVSRFGRMQLHGLLPQGSTLTVATRSGNVKDADAAGWSKWTDDVPASEFVLVGAPPARFLQYRLTFNSKDGSQTPVVQDVDTAYQIPNLAPVVKAVRLSDSQAQLPIPKPGTPPGAEPPKPVGTGTQTIAWDATDGNNDPLTFSLYFHTAPAGPWILLKDKLKDPTFEWDTKTVADGRYEVKVVASDAAANPVGMGKTGSRVSDPIVVDNTPPAIGDIKAETTDTSARIALRVADRTSTVALVEYVVDSGDTWQSTLPSDGIFDQPEETVNFTASNLSRGQHQITIRATDSRGNQSLANVTVNVGGPTTRGG
jgi:hypothetical protein